MEDLTNPRIVRILIVSQLGTNCSRLTALLSKALGSLVEIDSVPSMELAIRTVPERGYAMVLADGEPNSAPIQPTPSMPPIILLGARDNSHTSAVLRSVLCDCGSSERCLAMAALGAIDAYHHHQQRQSSDEVLRKLRSVVEQSPDPVMITDRSCVLEYVNPAFELLTGYAKAEVVGQTLGMLKSDEQAGELYEEMWDTVLSGKSFHGTVMNRKKNGETFVLEKSITPLRNKAGEITHYISTGRDITDKRRLEAQLQQAQKMDASGQLAGGVAHDFNNLLMVISAYAELMLDSLSADHALRPKVEEILTAARRAADLTRQLLAFGRKQMQSLQPLNLNSILAEVTRMLPRLIGEDIHLQVNAGSDLNLIYSDPVQIEQIIMNLAANARDAMPEGGKLVIETANVHLDQAYRQRHAVVPPGDYVLLSVTDSGSGIAKEHLGRIFEPFYTTKQEGKGTGLGLATVYGIVKQNGGYIWVYSELSMGTVFKIYLPIAKAAAAKESATHIQHQSPHGSETILLVEDEPAVRQSTREFLTSKGYTVLEATNGEEALRVSREYCGPIDLMISDVVMPKMSGPHLAENLAAERPRMRTLFMSGYAETTILHHGKIDVASRVLEKPFSFDALARKIREVLQQPAPLKQSASTSS